MWWINADIAIGTCESEKPGVGKDILGINCQCLVGCVLGNCLSMMFVVCCVYMLLSFGLL